MSQRQANHKKLCAKSRSEKLLRKVDHLTIQLEDVTSSIEVTIEAIKNEDSTSKERFEKYEFESRLRLENESNKFKHILGQEVDECTKLIHHKKMIGVQIEQLLIEKATEEKITSGRLDEIRKKMVNRIDQGRKEWKRGEKERESSWMSKRLKEIRERTLEALQPQVERLLESHKLELTKEEDKLASKEEYMRIDMERSFREQMFEYKSEFEQQARDRTDNRNTVWMQELCRLQQSRSNIIREMIRNNGRGDKETLQKQFNDERSQLEKKHILKLEQLEQNNKEDLHQLKHDFNSRIQQIRLDFASKTKDLEIKIIRTREISKQDNEKRLQSQFESKLASFRDEAKKQRECRLHAIIRSIQEEESVYELELQNKYEVEKKEILKTHNAMINSLKNEISEEQKRVSSDSQHLYRTESLKYIDDIELLNIGMDNSRKRLKEVECEMKQLEQNTTIKVNNLKENLEREKEKQNEIQKEIDDLQMKINETANQDELALILLERDKKIVFLETQVKNTIYALDADIEAAEIQIKRNENRLEKQKEILYNLVEVNT